MNFKQEKAKLGYNLEELYFERVNRELINKMKRQLRRQKQHQQKEQLAEVIQFRPRSNKNGTEKKAA